VIDRHIIDRAAEVIATRGSQLMTIRAVAEAAGYSKTGLLHRFPAKAVLLASVDQECARELHILGTAGARLPPGPDRDRHLIGLLARLATAKPGRGIFRLLVTRATDPTAGVRHQLFSAFEADAIAGQTRVLAALGALLTDAPIDVKLRVGDRLP
jgi:AcrR family transcriptional regulator